MAKETTIKVGGVDIPIWESTRNRTWRLVHDGAKLIALFESDGMTQTKHTLFEGTQPECLAEVDRLALAGAGDAKTEIAHGAIIAGYKELGDKSITEAEYACKILCSLVSGADIATAITEKATEIKTEFDAKGGAGTIVKP